MRILPALAALLVACSSTGDATTDATTSTTTNTTSNLSTSTGPDVTTGTSAYPPTTTTTTTSPTTTTAPTTTGTGTTGAPAGPCGQPAPFTGAMAQKIEAAGMERDYTLVVPGDYDPEHPYPLVFAWHGRGTTGGLARLYFKVEEAAEGQAIFVYPEGLPLADMNGQTGWDLAPDAEDVALFDAILADLSARLCVDDARIFSTGHSFGGYMSNALGCARGEVLRAIAPVAGGGPFSACTGQVAAWVTHGTLDNTVPYSQGEGSRDHWLATNQCGDTHGPADPTPCVTHDGCDDGLPVHWCSHSEPALGGHGWPDWAGPAIWSFFAAL